jgi:hypothetical protein
VARDELPLRLPSDLSARFVQVSPDDRITRSADLEWDGAIEEGR